MKKTLILIITSMTFICSYGQTKSEEYFKSGNSKFDLRDYQGAISDFNKAIEINPQDFNAYYRRALAKKFIKDYIGELADFNKIVEYKPTAYNYFNRGNAKEDLKDYQGAVSDQTKAIELDSTYYISYQSRGNAKFNLKDTVGALEDFAKVIEFVNRIVFNTRDSNDSLNLSRCGVPTFDRTKKLSPISSIKLNFKHEKSRKEVLQQRV